MRAAIVGAGIAGLTLAVALRQRGIDATVFESAPQLEAVGAGILLASNAMHIYQQLGIGAEILAAGKLVNFMTISDASLEPLTHTVFESMFREWGAASAAIHRGELQRILLASTGSSPRTGHRLAGLTASGDGATLKFASGLEESFDIVIGADGIHSTVRRSVQSNTQLRSAHQHCWRGIADMSLPPGFMGGGFEAWGSNARVGFAEIGNGKVYWFALVGDSKLAGERKPMPQYFSAFAPMVQELLANTPQNTIIETGISDLVPLRHWSIGPLCLIGDAAHATTPNLGQGACQAIEDAYLLAKLIAQAIEQGNRPQTCFATFQKLRSKRVNDVVSMSWRVGKMAHTSSRAGIWLRNHLMRALPAAINERQIRSVMKPQF